LDGQVVANKNEKTLFPEAVNHINQRLLSDTQSAIENNRDFSASYEVRATDRAVLATLSGVLAKHQSASRFGKASAYKGKLSLDFQGSAGQGFGVFMTEGLKVRLFGEANDSVAKGMSGGTLVIRPSEKAKFESHENTIIGNVALYGATGGTLYVNGLAGDRFAVRNSGAIAVVEGTGLHACEYMTNGKVVILGKTSYNMGAGMTGGELILFEDQPENINTEYLVKVALDSADLNELKALIEDYAQLTGSVRWQRMLKEWNTISTQFVKYLPIPVVEKQEIERIKDV
jgi:glutamate synthase domain-containing protein 3